MPSCFTHQSTGDEAQEVQCPRSPIVILKPRRHLTYLQYPFAGHGGERSHQPTGGPIERSRCAGPGAASGLMASGLGRNRGWRAMSAPLVSVARIRKAILLLRGQKVIVDRDLAVLYAVPTKALKQAVKRNIGRFPDDFMFVLTPEEFCRMEVTNCDLQGRAHGASPPIDGLHRAGHRLLRAVVLRTRGH
jgi:hypothetical protein